MAMFTTTSMPAISEHLCYRESTPHGLVQEPGMAVHQQASLFPDTRTLTNDISANARSVPSFFAASSWQEARAKHTFQSYPVEFEAEAMSTPSEIETEGSASEPPFAATLSEQLQCSNKSPIRKQTTYTKLQMELRELRSALEKKHAQHQKLGGMVHTNVYAGDGKPLDQHVASEALEREVRALCATVASQQAEQAKFLEMVLGEFDVLKDQCQASSQLVPAASANLSSSITRQLDELSAVVADHQQWKVFQEKNVRHVHSELDTLSLGFEKLKQDLRTTQELATIQKNSIDSEIRQLRLDVEDKISKQLVWLKSRKSEYHNIPSLMDQREQSSLAGYVERLAQCDDDRKAPHGGLIARFDSEVKSLRQELHRTELQVASTVEERLAEFQCSLQEFRNESLETLQKVQAEMESRHKKQDDQYMQAMKENNDLEMQMQADVNHLRDLLENRHTTPEDWNLQQEALQLIRTLQGEVDFLEKKHEEIGADSARKELALDLQTQSELKELRHEAQARTLDVQCIKQQLKVQSAQLEAFGSTAKVVAEAREVEAVSMSTAFEQQLQQHTQAIKSLGAQMNDLSEHLPTQVLDQLNDTDITKMKKELDTLKLASNLQQALQATEVAKETAAMHGLLDNVVATEREARVQDCTEMRALIKSLHEEMAQLTQHCKIVPLDQASISTSASGSNQAEMMKPFDVKRSVAADLSLTSFDYSPRDLVDRRRCIHPWSFSSGSEA